MSGLHRRGEKEEGRWGIRSWREECRLTSHAVVHTDELLPPQQGEGARGDRDALQRRPHSGAFCVADAVDVGDGDAGLAHGLLYEADDPSAVMPCRVLGQETLARRGDVGVAEVREDDGRLRRVRMLDDSNAELIGAAFEADGDHLGLAGWFIFCLNCLKGALLDIPMMSWAYDFLFT